MVLTEQCLPDLSVRQLVAHYYCWKKTDRYEAFLRRSGSRCELVCAC